MPVKRKPKVGEAEKQAVELYNRFKELHPMSKEKFVLTSANVHRWNWSIKQAESRNSVERQPFGMPDDRKAKVLAKSRAVGTFSRMPPMTRDRFLTLASLFPGRKVYATGSRITGEFVDADSPSKIRTMRVALMKADKVVSDYDVTLDFKPDDVFDELKARVPTWGDLILNVPKDEPKVEIPMWDFEKLPVELHSVVVDLVERKQWGQLMSIHNDYDLSGTTFCCDSAPAERWFTWAVDTGVIKKQVPEQAPPPKPPKPPTPKPEPG